jgi:RNA polymerase primary sigma factor
MELSLACPCVRSIGLEPDPAPCMRNLGVIDLMTSAKTEDQAQTETPEKDGPLLDLTDAAVKKLIKTAKARGYVTHDELNEVMPSGEVSSDQIEDIYAMLSEMGINVVEAEEA